MLENLSCSIYIVLLVGNEIVDTLGKHGAVQPSDTLAPLTYVVLYSTYNRGNDHSTIPPVHQQYQVSIPVVLCPFGTASKN
ncbi:hypothetical protein TNIN_397691 [Trichonephila inaurata madagascariensis]|uniref:Uncharacterized protein n=1 Tax=Trichonephila inaurata madagascariensis TaxID=2747483 RepID=A0A8X6M9W1_9ARAC|nr:hypothetical protein TNIN_397691 [Trichonephila inaurata madagascariensis]